jgi:hypothetical protein
MVTITWEDKLLLYSMYMSARWEMTYDPIVTIWGVFW